MFRWLKWSILLLVKRWNQKQKVCGAAVLLHRNKQWRDYLRRRRGVNGSINVKRSKSTCAPDNLPAGARTRKPRGRSLLRRQRRREVDRGTARLSERSAEKMLLQSFKSRILLLELIWIMFSFCADRLIISSINRLIDWYSENSDKMTQSTKCHLHNVCLVQPSVQTSTLLQIHFLSKSIQSADGNLIQ